MSDNLIIWCISNGPFIYLVNDTSCTQEKHSHFNRQTFFLTYFNTLATRVSEESQSQTSYCSYMITDVINFCRTYKWNKNTIHTIYNFITQPICLRHNFVTPDSGMKYWHHMNLLTGEIIYKHSIKLHWSDNI